MAYHISISLKDLAKVIRLRAHLQSLITDLQEKSIPCSLEEIVLSDRQFFLCHGGKSRSQYRELRKKLGEILAEFICDCKEPEIIRNIIQQEFHFHYNKEVSQIESFTQRLLEGSAWEYAKVVYRDRREKLAKQISNFLIEFPNLAIDGFVHFRMKSYRKALSRCVQDAVDEYLLDKEYKEFIQLLRYFVSVQNSKIALVHVIHEGKKHFHVLKEDGSPLQLREMDGAFQEVMEQTFSHEDFIVSTLLTIAPERVILHTKYPDENVIRTLIQIFEGRIVVCNGCSECGLSLNFHGDA
jgi:putative sporulation protein YtxC